MRLPWSAGKILRLWRRKTKAGAYALNLPERVKPSGLNKNTMLLW